MAKQKKSGEALNQQLIPGTEPVKNDRVHRSAMRYARLRDARIEAGRQEKDSHDTLLSVMQEEGIDSYTYGSISVNIDLKRKAKVTTESSGGSGEDAGE